MADEGGGSLHLYRESKLGNSLVESLEQLVNSEKISTELALKVLEVFDKAFLASLKTKVQAKVTFKGQLDMYRSCDNVWTFYVSDAVFKINNSGGSTSSSTEEIAVKDKVKLICMDARLSGPEQ